MQHKCCNTINTGVAMQDNATKQQWYSTILSASTISNTGKFAKMEHPDFLVNMRVGILITLAQKINDCRQWPMMKILMIIIGKIIHPTLSPISAYYPYFHSLLAAHTTALPQERQSPVKLECGSKQCNLTDILMILLVSTNLPLAVLSLMNPLAQTSSHS